MHRFRRLLVVQALAIAMAAGAVPPVIAATDSARHPGALFTLTISGIDRDGTVISSPSASVYGVNNVSYLSGGSSVNVPAGTYIVAAPIWRPADNGSQTLVAQKVHVTSNKHVTLDAQGAAAVTATLTGAGGTTQGAQNVELCFGSGSNLNAVTGFQVDPTATAYVKAMSAAGVRTVYQIFWQNGGGVYDLAGAFSGGIPAHPDYHAQPSGMAKVRVVLPDYENVTPLAILFTSYDECATSTEPVTGLPADYTDYRTPGSWTTNLNFGSLPDHVQRDLYKTATYQAGHSYTDLFGSAAYGPGRDFPQIDGTHVVYGPGDLLDDPVAGNGFNCEGRAKVQLKHGPAVVKTQNLAFCKAPTVFTAHPASSGWYTLTATAVRWNPSGSLPAILLSTKVSMSWHFRYAPVTGHPINAQAAPVTVTVFQPEGLDIANAAPPGTTTVKLTILRGGGLPVPTPKYPLHPVHVQASFDDGLTWHTVSVTPHAGYWLAQVHDSASGYVSLRSVVTDSHGDSTTETIIRAYQVA